MREDIEFFKIFGMAGEMGCRKPQQGFCSKGHSGEARI